MAMVMIRLAPFLLASLGVAAFQTQKGAFCRTKLASRGPRHPGVCLSADDDAGLTREIGSLDADLASEIEEALSLAQDALADVAAAEDATSTDDDDIDEIAAMLLSPPPPRPAPPKEDPPPSVVSLGLREGAADNLPLPPESPPPADGVDFGEIAWKEIERLKNLMFGLTEELGKTEATTKEAEDTTAELKKEIEASITERKATVERIESEFASENELLLTQMEIASDELQAAKDQSAQNITEEKSKSTRAEKELISRIDSLKTTIDGVTASSIDINLEKERLLRSRESMLNRVFIEGKKKIVQFQKSREFDINYATQRNADLARRADEAESKVRGVYDRINDMRTERETLQQQMIDVETEALEEIETLQRELKQDDTRYNSALAEERSRMDNVIDERYKSYAAEVCEKVSERQSVEADYKEKLRVINLKISDAKEKEKARVKEYLDKLEEKHKKERIVVYQEKVEAVAEVRKQMNEELAVEYAKIEETHKTMRAKIDAVNKQTARLKADFEKEMAKKRQLTKEVEEEIRSQISDVREDMTDKMKTQQRLYKENFDALLADMNVEMSKSEGELRQKWRELAITKKSLADVRERRDGAQKEVTKKQALIDSYERDRSSFRTSVRLTVRAARERIGRKTRLLLKKVKKNTH